MALICFAFAFGGFVSVKTKAYVSSVIVACLIGIGGFLTGVVPPELVATSGFAGMVATFVIPLCIIDVGSQLRIEQLKQEWKTVVMNLAATAGIIVFVGTIGTLIFGKQYALSSIPPLTGALVATTIVQQQAVQVGAATIAMFAFVVLILQSLAGLPMATVCLKRELKAMKKNGVLADYIAKSNAATNLAAVGAETLAIPQEEKFLIPPLPKSWQSDAMILFKMAFLGFVANFVAGLTVIPNSNPTNYILNPNLAYLFFAIAAANLGLIERNPLTKSCSRGIIFLALLSLLIHTFATVSGKDIAEQFLPSVGVILIGAVGIVTFCWVASKILKASPWIAIAVGFTCYLGYPGSQIVVEESVRSSGLTEEEQKAANSILVPRMVLGYFVASITSVIVAGIIAPLIF
jgi:hypothetical protein